jgi:preprotein translocase subunit YajC
MLALILMAPAPSGGAGGGDGMSSIIQTVAMMAAIIFIFYFMMIRPQQKRQKEHQRLLNEIKSGDKVVTSSGIHGTVSSVEDSVVVLTVADNVRMRFEKAAIASVEAKK